MPSFYFSLAIGVAYIYIMGMPKPIPHSRDFIEAAFMSASSILDVVDTLGCSRATCYNYAKRWGLELPPSRPRGGRCVETQAHNLNGGC